MFDRIAGRYDLLNHLLSFGLDFHWRRRAVEALQLKRGDRVIDLCCGTGDLSHDLYRVTGEVVGVDFSTEMLTRARRKYPEIRYLESDACGVPGEGGFQAATLAFGPRNIPDLDALWREMLRLVVPGGRVLALELTRPQGLLGVLHAFYLNHVLPVLGSIISGDGPAYRYLSRTVAGFLDPRELAASMEKAGLVDVRLIPLNGGIATIHMGRKP